MRLNTYDDARCIVKYFVGVSICQTYYEYTHKTPFIIHHILILRVYFSHMSETLSHHICLGCLCFSLPLFSTLFTLCFACAMCVRMWILFSSRLCSYTLTAILSVSPLRAFNTHYTYIVIVFIHRNVICTQRHCIESNRDCFDFSAKKYRFFSV